MLALELIAERKIEEAETSGARIEPRYYEGVLARLSHDTESGSDPEFKR